MSWIVTHQHHPSGARSYEFDTQADADQHAYDIRVGKVRDISDTDRRTVLVYEWTADCPDCAPHPEHGLPCEVVIKYQPCWCVSSYAEACS